MEQLEIIAQKRTATGKNEMSRMRKQGRIPGVLYGLEKEPVLLTLDPASIRRILKSKGGMNTLCSLRVEGATESELTMMREFQTHPIRQEVLHADFVRISMTTKLKFKVPIHVEGVPVGVKEQGGILEFIHRTVEVECLPTRIPERIDLDVSALKIGEFMRFADLKPGEDVEILSELEEIVVSVAAPRIEAEPEPAAEAAPEEAAEPEVIGKKKKAEEEPEAEEGKKEKKEKE